MTDDLLTGSLHDDVSDDAQYLRQRMHKQYRIPLRGENINPMIDAATPLLGMVMRMHTLSGSPLPDKLYQQVVTDIQAIEQQLQSQGYEPGAIVSFRYVLCTFIDETALGLGWNTDNGWVKKSLLVHFHNESWGGEKVFILIERLLGEPKRYLDLIEFIWLCLCLGYRGRYKVTQGHNDEFNRLLRRLQKQIRQLRPEQGSVVLYEDTASDPHRYRPGKRLRLKYIFIAGLLLAAGIYGLYLSQLNNQTQHILEQLTPLLSQGIH